MHKPAIFTNEIIIFLATFKALGQLCLGTKDWTKDHHWSCCINRIHTIESKQYDKIFNNSHKFSEHGEVLKRVVKVASLKTFWNSWYNKK